jgi:LysM repeat protein
MRRKIINLTLICCLVLIPLLRPTANVRAESISAGDLINLINNIRTGTYGFPALQTNPIVMAHAQWTAETMSSLGIHGHLADNGYLGVRARLANAGYGSGSTVFATENWAGGGTTRTLSNIQSDWADAAHMRPMVDGSYKDIGAGVATDSSGYTVFIVIAAYTVGGSSSSSDSSSSVIPTSQSQNWNVISPVITATPNADGSIVHVVESGQFLSTIATDYGVTVAQIKALNSLTSDAIFVGQKLIIRLAPTITITPTRTATVPRPTRTPTLTQAPPTTRPTLTATPTPKPSLSNVLPRIDRQWLGFGLILVSAIGFFIVFYFSFLKSSRKK